MAWKSYVNGFFHFTLHREQNSKREHKTCSLYTCLPTVACFLSAPPSSSPLFIVPTVEKRWMTQKETTQRSSDFGWEKSFWPCFTSITFHHHHHPPMHALFALFCLDRFNFLLCALILSRCLHHSTALLHSLTGTRQIDYCG